MTTISQDMIDIIEKSKLMFVATVNDDGSPNLSPKGSVRVLDDKHLIFADIASPDTIDNLRARPSIEINVVDFLSRRGYRFGGTAEVLDPTDPACTHIATWLREANGDSVPCHHAVRIEVTRAEELHSPAYTFQKSTEPEPRHAWMSKYGLVQP